MNYSEAISYIHSIPKFRRPLGNAQLARLLAAAGNPQDRLRFIHIAGTNGKGSAAAMLSEILCRSGYRVGMFTSPFIEVFNERIQINGSLIPDDELAEYASRTRALMEENEAFVSEFAFITAAAFMYFCDRQCDIVVLETGMGGRLDATNIIKTPELCVLMSIGFDHMQFLGSTIEEIAAEKCGIIKDGVPVVSYPNEGVRAVIEAEAKKHGSELVFAGKPMQCADGFMYKGKHYALSLKGAYQPYNAAVVLEAADMLRTHGFDIPDAAVRDALANTHWAVRYEFIRDNLVIDGGHNIDGIRALRKSLEADGRGVIAVTAMMSDKSVDSCIEVLAGCTEKIYCTELDMPRCEKADVLVAAVRKCGGNAVVCAEPVKAVEAALADAGDDKLVCVCGSLYLAGEVRKELTIDN